MTCDRRQLRLDAAAAKRRLPIRRQRRMRRRVEAKRKLGQRRVIFAGIAFAVNVPSLAFVEQDPARTHEAARDGVDGTGHGGDPVAEQLP